MARAPLLEAHFKRDINTYGKMPLLYLFRTGPMHLLSMANPGGLNYQELALWFMSLPGIWVEAGPRGLATK